MPTIPTIMFEAGNKVRLKPEHWDSGSGLPKDGIFTIGAVVPLPFPHSFYVDPYYWGTKTYGWAREKTRLEVAGGHPQVVFLEGVPEYDTNRLQYPRDPDNRGRQGFSGAWFEAA